MVIVRDVSDKHVHEGLGPGVMTLPQPLRWTTLPWCGGYWKPLFAGRGSLVVFPRRNGEP